MGPRSRDIDIVDGSFRVLAAALRGESLRTSAPGPQFDVGDTGHTLYSLLVQFERSASGRDNFGEAHASALEAKVPEALLDIIAPDTAPPHSLAQAANQAAALKVLSCGLLRKVRPWDWRQLPYEGIARARQVVMEAGAAPMLVDLMHEPDDEADGEGTAASADGREGSPEQDGDDDSGGVYDDDGGASTNSGEGADRPWGNRPGARPLTPIARDDASGAWRPALAAAGPPAGAAAALARQQLYVALARRQYAAECLDLLATHTLHQGLPFNIKDAAKHWDWLPAAARLLAAPRSPRVAALGAAGLAAGDGLDVLRGAYEAASAAAGLIASLVKDSPRNAARALSAGVVPLLADLLGDARLVELQLWHCQVIAALRALLAESSGDETLRDGWAAGGRLLPALLSCPGLRRSDRHAYLPPPPTSSAVTLSGAAVEMRRPATAGHRPLAPGTCLAMLSTGVADRLRGGSAVTQLDTPPTDGPGSVGSGDGGASSGGDPAGGAGMSRAPQPSAFRALRRPVAAMRGGLRGASGVGNVDACAAEALSLLHELMFPGQGCVGGSELSGPILGGITRRIDHDWRLALGGRCREAARAAGVMPLLAEMAADGLECAPVRDRAAVIYQQLEADARQGPQTDGPPSRYGRVRRALETSLYELVRPSTAGPQYGAAGPLDHRGGASPYRVRGQASRV